MRASRCEARRTYCRTPRRASLAGAPASAARATADTCRMWRNALRRERCLRFVRIFGACSNVVFRGQKICLRYFKIGQTYFEICALYFFFAPMWGKRTENQFSIFRTQERPFSAPVFRSPMSVYAYAWYFPLSLQRAMRRLVPVTLKHTPGHIKNKPAYFVLRTCFVIFARV